MSLSSAPMKVIRISRSSYSLMFRHLATINNVFFWLQIVTLLHKDYCVPRPPWTMASSGCKIRFYETKLRESCHHNNPLESWPWSHMLRTNTTIYLTHPYIKTHYYTHKFWKIFTCVVTTVIFTKISPLYKCGRNKYALYQHLRTSVIRVAILML